MKRLLVLACLIAACGGPQSKPDPKSPPAAGSGSDAPAADCPDHIDCMPPTEGACPPPGLQERCPKTMITY